jgi:hypothetical protein
MRRRCAPAELTHATVRPLRHGDGQVSLEQCLPAGGDHAIVSTAQIVPRGAPRCPRGQRGCVRQLLHPQNRATSHPNPHARANFTGDRLQNAATRVALGGGARSAAHARRRSQTKENEYLRYRRCATRHLHDIGTVCSLAVNVGPRRALNVRSPPTRLSIPRRRFHPTLPHSHPLFHSAHCSAERCRHCEERWRSLAPLGECACARVRIVFTSATAMR